MVITTRAYAKINLFLDVLGRRPDGYHDISTVMRTVSLCDDVTLKLEPGAPRRIDVRCGGGAPDGEDNIAYAAAAAFLDAARIEDGAAEIVIDKRIPVAAGLAGGSADAAAVLRLLNRAFGSPFSAARLREIAVKLGADVPFCVTGGLCTAGGIGEIIAPLPSEGALFGAIVVAIGKTKVRTADAYAAVDRLAERERRSPDALIDALRDGDAKRAAKELYNVFESAVFPLNPEPRRLKERLLALGASGALMSGSGPSVFGLFADAGDAETARRALEAEGYTAYRCESV